MSYYGWAPYVSVAERKAKALKHVEGLAKKGIPCNPIQIQGRKIASTFWGKAWCDNLEKYSDYANRLPRGRTYVRNGSVIDLQVSKGKVNAQVMGSSLYQIEIKVTALPQSTWKTLVSSCAGKIDSLIELLKGEFSQAVMEIITAKDEGLFPKPKEIKMKCSCPDSASLCKHLAAVLYGIGASLDSKPQWLFTLRGVDQMDLIATATAGGSLGGSLGGLQAVSAGLDDGDLANLFGIEMAEEPVAPVAAKKRVASKATKEPTKAAVKRTTKKKATD